MKQIAARVLILALAIQGCRRGAVADPAADRDAVNAALEQYRQAWLKGDGAPNRRPDPRHRSLHHRLAARTRRLADLALHDQ